MRRNLFLSVAFRRRRTPDADALDSRRRRARDSTRVVPDPKSDLRSRRRSTARGSSAVQPVSRSSEAFGRQFGRRADRGDEDFCVLFSLSLQEIRSRHIRRTS